MTYQLKNTPPDIRKILIAEQAVQMKEKSKIISREFIIYKIIREWEKLKKESK